MTRIIEIPDDRWTSFVDTINRLAQGRAVRLEVASREIGDQDMAEMQPLIGIDWETKGSERGEIVVSVDSDRGALIHVVAWRRQRRKLPNQ